MKTAKKHCTPFDFETAKKLKIIGRWVSHRIYDQVSLITEINTMGVFIAGYVQMTYKDLLREFVFTDTGAPCGNFVGKKEKEIREYYRNSEQAEIEAEREKHEK